MTDPHESIVVLSRALDQAGDVLTAVHTDQLDRPTPCEDWTVAELVAHLVATPGRFVQMGRGEEVDWSGRPEAADGVQVAEFRAAADDLIHQWHQRGDTDAPMADWQTAELAVHTWDLVRATGQEVPLDPEVAERGLAFMKQALTADNRGEAFGPQMPVADDAPPYDRLAAWAGRDPS